MVNGYKTEENYKVYFRKLTQEQMDKRKQQVTNKFYTVEPVYTNVSQADFEDFLKSYPRKLVVDACAICDPCVISYNDFELADKWPYSIVASTYDDDSAYKIMANYEEVFASKRSG